jgi:hypothetical protein
LDVIIYSSKTGVLELEKRSLMMWYVASMQQKWSLPGPWYDYRIPGCSPIKPAKPCNIKQNRPSITGPRITLMGVLTPSMEVFEG